MLITIAVILLILWLLGIIGHIGGGFVFILLVVAIAIVLFDRIDGRRL